MRTLLVLALAAVAAVAAAEPYVDPTGAFTYAVPKNWTLKASPGQVWPAAMGPSEGGFQPSLTVEARAYDGTIASLMLQNLQAFASYDPQATLAEQSTLTAQGGITVYKVVIDSVAGARPLRMALYFFSKSAGLFYLMTGTAPATAKGAFDPVFDTAVKSFRFLK